MNSESHPGPSAPRKRSFLGIVMGFTIAVGATAVAAVAVMLPWGLRNRYASVLRWFRNLLMQNSRAVRKWALRKRWEWDSDEN